MDLLYTIRASWSRRLPPDRAPYLSNDPPLELRVLGPVTVRHRDDPPAFSRVSQPRLLALLCYLALARPRGLHARDTLMALLWPEHDDTRARRGLRNALHGVRRDIGADALISVGDQLVGLNEQRITCDVIALERGVAAPIGAADSSQSASAEPLSGLHVDGAPLFSAWLEEERARIRRLLERAAPTDTGSTVPIRTTRTTHAQDAFAHYLRGHYLFLRAAHGGSPDELLQSQRCFERALALEPTFAPALAGLANFFAVAARRGVLTPFEDTFAKTIAYSEQAAALDPSLAIPHVHFGVQALYLHEDPVRAGQEFALAAQKEPDYVEGRRFYGVWLGLMSRFDEALVEMQAAALMEPDIPHMQSSLAAALLAVGDREQAEAVLHRTLLLDPCHAPARERLVRLYEDEGRYAEAVAERLRGPGAPGTEALVAAWEADGAAGYHRALDAMLREAAESLAAKLVERVTLTVNDRFSPPEVRLVALYARLGEWKKARAWQLQAVAQRPGLAPWFTSLPELRAAP